jgi:hypothetical protein
MRKKWPAVCLLVSLRAQMLLPTPNMRRENIPLEATYYHSDMLFRIFTAPWIW